MATRSLTEVFILMRNNAMQSRHIYSEQQMTDRMSLVGSDVESGLELRRTGESRMPPAWADGLEEAQYSLTRLRAKINDLETLHTRHLHRPTLDDSSEEEQQIEALTQEITRMFSAAHRLIQQIRHQSGEGGQQEQRLSYNVVASLVATLQELSTIFRRSQNSYLKKLNSREERSRQYFDTALDQDFSQGADWEVDSEVDNIDQQFGLGPTSSGHLTQQQLLLLEEDNTRMAARREHEVRQIVKSIADLNDIFKDLAHMVADQFVCFRVQF
ncbi:syntaxin-16 isoform X2 [Periplaneta americana]|uniref:syntaxin-16 isoform X2 n=1 Tax=Periplaneta americana TaxID=6978 RepID=UPI0037E864F7